jgi:hypothetical protein
MAASPGGFGSMAITIQGSQGLFSFLQEALQHQAGGCIRLFQGVHDTLDDFRWLDGNFSSYPAYLYKIMPQQDLLLK